MYCNVLSTTYELLTRLSDSRSLFMNFEAKKNAKALSCRKKPGQNPIQQTNMNRMDRTRLERRRRTSGRRSRAQRTGERAGARAASGVRRAARRAGAAWTSTGRAGAGCCSPSSRRDSRTSAEPDTDTYYDEQYLTEGAVLIQIIMQDINCMYCTRRRYFTNNH